MKNIIVVTSGASFYLPRRAGERYASALTNMNLSNKVYKYFGKRKLREYVRNFTENNN